MRGIFYNFAKNLARIFWGKNLIWHVLAILVTFLLVISGFDWYYYQSTRILALNSFFFPAVVLGGLLPILIPLVLIILGFIKKNFKIKNIAFALAQSAIIGAIVSSFYKSITGRSHPNHEVFSKLTDLTRTFDFGFFDNGIFWGWPSSHTTIAFAMAVSLGMLYPKNKTILILAVAYAFYVGIGVSMTIHWFSDFAAGIVFGSMIGYTVGKEFWKRGKK